MSTWTGSVAIVTGAAGGNGAAPHDTLRAVQQGEGMIVVPFSGRLHWRSSCATPSVGEIGVRHACNAERQAAARGERRHDDGDGVGRRRGHGTGRGCAGSADASRGAVPTT